MILLFWRRRGIRRKPTGEGVLVTTPGVYVFGDERFDPFIPAHVEAADHGTQYEIPVPMMTKDRATSFDQVGMLKDQTRLLEK